MKAAPTRYRALLLALLPVLGLLVWVAWQLMTGQGGRPDVALLEARVAAQKVDNERLRARNQALAADVEDLKSGREAVEERAREELGMVRPGETFYQVVEPRPREQPDERAP